MRLSSVRERCIAKEMGTWWVCEGCKGVSKVVQVWKMDEIDR